MAGLWSGRGKVSLLEIDGDGEERVGDGKVGSEVEDQEETSWRKVMMMAWRLGRIERMREVGPLIVKSCGS